MNPTNPGSLSGKSAIVTGSTSGIGRAVAEALSGAGAGVIVTGRDVLAGEQTVDHIRSSGGEAAFVEADLQDKTAPDTLVSAAIRQWGRLDIVVNNAAVICNKPVEQVTHEDWDRLFAVNLKAPFFLVQAALPHLLSGPGAVINVSSINGVINSKNNFVYDAMKAGLNHMTRGLAKDLLDRGVRFNALMPAGVATPMLEQWIRTKFTDPETAERKTAELQASKQVGQPRQIADAVLYLAGDGASWLNGAVIPITGGHHI